MANKGGRVGSVWLTLQGGEEKVRRLALNLWRCQPAHVPLAVGKVSWDPFSPGPEGQPNPCCCHLPGEVGPPEVGSRQPRWVWECLPGSDLLCVLRGGGAQGAQVRAWRRGLHLSPRFPGPREPGAGRAPASRVAESWPTLCDPRDCSPPGSSVHGILQARTLERVAISFSRGSSRPGDGTCVCCFGRRILYHESPGKTPMQDCGHCLEQFSS